MVEMLVVGGVDRAPVLQALEHHERRVEKRHSEQDQRQHERDHHRRLDCRLDGYDSHQQAEQVRPAIAHETGSRGKIVDQEAECRTGGDGGQHSGFCAIEVEGDDRERAGDDHAHPGRQAVDTVGEIDDVHHHYESEHSQHRPGVREARVGEVKLADERQRDQLHGHSEVHDDHRRCDLAGQLCDRRQVEAVVQCSHSRDERSSQQYAVPHLRARSIAGRQERQHRDEHTCEDRQAAEQGGGAVG